ncbi:MAG: ATP-grasp domain-containing protein [Candidatus Paceibacterota bacterium]
MKFLIQKINGEIRHDFTFALLESIRFKNWLNRNDKKDKIMVKFLDYIEITEPNDIYPIQFKPCHKNYVPVGSVEFVTEFLGHFYGLKPKPINVPECLFEPRYSHRPIFNGTDVDIAKLHGKWFVKSNDKIKGFAEILQCDKNHVWGIPKGNYQISEFISIDSEWRTFIYEGKILGLQNYSGEFMKFPKIEAIQEMVAAFEKSDSAPIAYTLDIGVNDYHTFVIEAHDFFSCGLYGFNDIKYPSMLNKWFNQYLKNNEI